jgi:hypothetical protein
MGKGPRKNGQKQGQQAADAPDPHDGQSLAVAPPAVAPPAAECLTQDIYAGERKLLLDLLKENTDQHDKAILTLTAGMLGLTLTFISNIAPHPPLWTMKYLVLGWGGLIVSIIAMLGSFLTGQWACEHQIELLNQHAQKGVRPDQTNYWSTWTRILNTGSLCSFVIGIIFIAIFSGINMLKREPTEPAKGDQTATQGGQDLADTPKLPPVTLPSRPAAPPSNPGTGHIPPTSPVTPAAPPPSPPPTKK